MTSLLVSAKQFGYLRVCVTRGLLVIQTLSVRVIAVICTLSLHPGLMPSYAFICLLPYPYHAFHASSLLSSLIIHTLPNIHSCWSFFRSPAPHQVLKPVHLTSPHSTVHAQSSLLTNHGSSSKGSLVHFTSTILILSELQVQAATLG